MHTESFSGQYTNLLRLGYSRAQFADDCMQPRSLKVGNGNDHRKPYRHQNAGSTKSGILQHFVTYTCFMKGAVRLQDVGHMISVAVTVLRHVIDDRFFVISL